MAATQFQIWGFAHLTGQTVSAFVGGLDCGDYTVAADGSITVPVQSDPDKLLTESYLASLNSITAWGEIGALITLNGLDTPTTVTVPVAIGLKFTTQGQIVRPATEADTHNKQGAGFGMIRRNYQLGVLLHNTVGVQFGTDFASSLYPARLVAADQTTALAHNVMFDGVSWNAVADGSSYDGMITWQMTRPYPVTVAAITGFLEVEER